MNYWEKWIGAWKKKTAQLSFEEKGAYGELLDWLYANDTATLPPSVDAIYRLAGAQGASERKAVETVIAGFFERGEQGYTHERVHQEITKRAAYIAKQTERALERWQREREAGEKKAKGNGKDEAPPLTLPDWIAPEPWARWIKIRPAKARTPDALHAVIARLNKMRAEGHDPNEIIANSLANGWQGLFSPDQKRGAHAQSATERPSITCSACGKRAYTWTDGLCNPCWRTRSGIPAAEHA